MRLHLGCSDDFKSNWLNVDVEPPPAGSIAFGDAWKTPKGFLYRRADLNYLWPWESGTVDEIVANDVFEHLKTKIWAMNEAHRVLKAGGLLRFTVPAVCLSDGRVNVGAFADPTHRTFWTLDDCFYFGEQWNTSDMERGRLGAAYGITALFRFPPMVDCGAKGWRVADYRGSVEQLEWKLEEANGRAKIRAVLEAVKL